MKGYYAHIITAFNVGVLVGTSVSMFICIQGFAKLGKKLKNLKSYVILMNNDLKLLTDHFNAEDWKDPAFTSPSEEDEKFEEAYGGDDGNEDPVPFDLTVTVTYFESIDKKLNGTQTEKEQAYKDLINHKTQNSGNAEFLWRLSKAAYIMSEIENGKGNADNKKKFVKESRLYSQQSLDLDPYNANVHKWCAISLGVIGEYETMQDRIANGYKIKNHIDKAIYLDGRDYSVHYMLGRWCYEVYMLSWVERQIASTLFATPPTATIEEALAAFFQSEKLNPRKYKANMLYIAKCYVSQGQYSDAVKWLNFATECEIVTAEDKENQSEIDQLLSKYKSYES